MVLITEKRRFPSISLLSHNSYNNIKPPLQPTTCVKAFPNVITTLHFSQEKRERNVRVKRKGCAAETDSAPRVWNRQVAATATPPPPLALSLSVHPCHPLAQPVCRPPMPTDHNPLILINIFSNALSYILRLSAQC